MSINVIELDSASEEDEGFKEFIESLRSGNVEAVFMITKEDGTTSVGSTAKNPKDLVWDIFRLTRLSEAIVNGSLD